MHFVMGRNLRYSLLAPDRLQGHSGLERRGMITSRSSHGLPSGNARTENHLYPCPKSRGHLSSEHFSVDGTLIEAWSAVKSMRRRDGKDDPPPPGRNPHVDFHGQPRTNETHVAPHEPQAKLFRKGKGHLTKLYYMAHVLME